MPSGTEIVVDNIIIKINSLDLIYYKISTLYFISYQSVMMFKLIRTMYLTILKA
jgi:hypothetical protein